METKHSFSLFDWFKRPVNKVVTNSKFAPEIALEKTIGAQIYNALQGDVVEAVLKKTKVKGDDTYWRSSMEGHSLKVAKELLPDVYDMCQEVMKKLNFTEKVDFYITGDSSVNAFSVAAESEEESHIVNINSALFDLMTADELRFVIGHELGHLVNKDTALARLIYFVFPTDSNMPITLQYKIRLHQQLAELVADRYGYMAVENLDACVTAFFKMASGIDLAKMNVSIDQLIADNTRRLKYFLEGKGLSRESHPVNPIRVEALHLFSTAKDQATLDKKMDELISILLRLGSSEIDEYTARFIASAGLIVANSDAEINSDEVDQILKSLSGLKIFPRQFLEEISQQDVTKVFSDSVNKLLEINPGMRDGMLDYMISIIISDKKIAPGEVDLIYKFGNDVGLSEIEIATAIAESIQANYIPDLNDIC